MNPMEIGVQFFQEIEAARTNGRWRWEKRLPGPLNYSDVSTICHMAGCWCDIPSAGVGEEIRFYTNQNHPSHGGRW